MIKSRNSDDVTNINSIDDGGKKIMMTNNTISTTMTMKVFAEAVKKALVTVYGAEYSVELRDVTKNNNCCLTGLCIRKDDDNMAPVIYLDAFYEEYLQRGISIEEVCAEVVHTYKISKTNHKFDTYGVMDFEQVKDNICFKLVNAQKNQELLADVPHIKFLDLAIIYFILISKDSARTGTIMVRNNIMDMWGVDTDELYNIALRNTQRLFRGTVSSMSSVISEMIYSGEDDESIDDVFDMEVGDADAIPLYVATNFSKINGAGVILYDNLLKEFADRINSDFFILPSSIHETLFVPVSFGADERGLAAMVRDVNANQVAADEVLSDNVYRYNRVTDRVEMI